MSNEQKTPLARTLPLFVEKKIREWIDRQGKAMPGHVLSVQGPIVTVNFDIQGLLLPLVKMPLAGSEYVRLPIQEGDKGVCFPVDFGIGCVSGLGSANVSDTTPQGNLSTLVWFPVGSKSWSTVDANAVTLYGPNGVVLRDSQSKTTSTLTPTGISDSAQDTYSITAGSSITLTVGSHSIVINASGITIDGVAFLLHTHSAVQTGSGVSGPVVP